LNQEEVKKPTVKTRIWTGLAAGLYPFLHYYSNNFNIADSWVQFSFLLLLCILIPVGVALVLPSIFSLGPLKRLQKYALTAFNFLYFTILLSLLIFHFKNMLLAVILTGIGLLSLILYRFLNKVVLLQLLLAVMSLVTLVPKLFFVFSYDDGWKDITENVQEVKLKTTPNIYMIQPDGYANFSELRKASYNDLDTSFENWLTDEGFVNYPNFRSNYFNTLTSNSSAFAMKHHYYGNVNRNNEKTQGAMEDIVGANNALSILNNNGYNTHLFTDNSFFLLNRKLKAYDYCNIPMSKLPYYKLGKMPGIDILSDFKNKLEEKPEGPNFFFIEKITPGHIKNLKMGSGGIAIGREKYLLGVQQANEWLTSLIEMINAHDDNALIIIMADHGGSVGLEYSSELKERTLNAAETASVFSVLLSIKWPEGSAPENLNFKTNVNLFRNLFYHLSEDPIFMKSYQADKSYLYNLESGQMEVYQCIDENGEYGYIKVD
jgi:hypothetical protein